jgi:hypothetical protein
MSVDEWRNDPIRGPWVRNSLAYRRDDLKIRAAATRARKASLKSHMGEVANYLADAYDEAAAVFQRKLDECKPDAAATQAATKGDR